MTTLYKQYEKLVEKGIARKTIDIVTDHGEAYEIHTFVYDFTANYTDFYENSYLRECRGISFLKTETTETVIAKPFEKFWNAYENPFTAKEVIDRLAPRYITEKLDGSLIMVMQLPSGALLAKTKTTLKSEQAVRATEIIRNDPHYREFCEQWIERGYTPLFEFTSPLNQVVLFYAEEKLSLIGLRHMETGDYYDIHDYFADFGNIPVVTCYDITLEDITKLQETSKNEGFVVEFSNSQRMKFKTLDYCMRHRQKSNIMNIKNLVEIILLGKLDDLKSLFNNDVSIENYINNVEIKTNECKKQILFRINEFYISHNLLDRKNYAIEAQERNKDIMSLLMDKYLGRITDEKINNYILKNDTIIETPKQDTKPIDI